MEAVTEGDKMKLPDFSKHERLNNLKREMGIKPKDWEVTPGEFLGHDEQGRQFFRIGHNVFSYQDGATRWFCEMAAFETGVKAYNITKAS